MIGGIVSAKRGEMILQVALRGPRSSFFVLARPNVPSDRFFSQFSCVKLAKMLCTHWDGAASAERRFTQAMKLWRLWEEDPALRWDDILDKVNLFSREKSCQCEPFRVGTFYTLNGLCRPTWGRCFFPELLQDSRHTAMQGCLFCLALWDHPDVARNNRTKAAKWWSWCTRVRDDSTGEELSNDQMLSIFNKQTYCEIGGQAAPSLFDQELLTHTSTNLWIFPHFCRPLKATLERTGFLPLEKAD